MFLSFLSHRDSECKPPKGRTFGSYGKPGAFNQECRGAPRIYSCHTRACLEKHQKCFPQMMVDNQLVSTEPAFECTQTPTMAPTVRPPSKLYCLPWRPLLLKYNPKSPPLANPPNNPLSCCFPPHPACPSPPWAVFKEELTTNLPTSYPSSLCPG